MNGAAEAATWPISAVPEGRIRAFLILEPGGI
jgi:hypothetical protein